MTALDVIPDFGERIGRDGELVDEFAEVLTAFPSELAADPDVVMLAGAITRHRCDGTGDIARAIAAWRPEGLTQ